MLIWIELEPHRISRAMTSVLAAGLADQQLAVSTLTFWEAGNLVSKARIAIGSELEDWRLSWLEEGLIEIPPDGEIAVRAVDLTDLHRDPVDRLIVATALVLNATLVTADEAMLAWPGDLERLDPRR